MFIIDFGMLLHYVFDGLQELQHDIERHSPGVGSVLNLCEVLLHDTDACPTDVEFNGLQTAMKNLERRWRSICQLAPDMRTRLVPVDTHKRITRNNTLKLTSIRGWCIQEFST